MMVAIGFEQIKRIYDSLGDASSRSIFEKRFMYSLSGDLGYIREMVSLEMGRYGNADIMMRLFAWLDEQKSPVVIFGAGFAGWQIADVLLYAGKEVRCFADNNSGICGTEKQGLKVCSPDVLSELKECCVVIGMNSSVLEVKRQIRELGVDEQRIFVPEKTWWLGPETQYFDRSIMIPGSHEAFVDGGALDGGDSREFMKWCRGDFEAVWIFEPDKENCGKIKASGNTDKKIHVCEEGLWSAPGELKFSAGNRENSAVSEDGDTVIRVTSVDEKLGGEAVSMIKMDIEGCELEALKGAESTIKQHKPRLAICVYHKPEDIVEIPLKILELNSEYRLFLRHYSYVETETVLYAV